MEADKGLPAILHAAISDTNRSRCRLIFASHVTGHVRHGAWFPIACEGSLLLHAAELNHLYSGETDHWVDYA